MTLGDTCVSPGSRIVPFTMRTAQSKASDGVPIPIQPSPISRAIAVPLGPNAESRIGTSIGRGFANSG